MALTPAQGIATEWFLWAISVIMVLLRLYVHFWLQAIMTISDLLCVMAVGFSLYATITNTTAYRWGIWGGHIGLGGDAYGSLHLSQQEAAEIARRVSLHFKLTFASILSYYCSLWCIKFQFLLFYYKLFPTAPRRGSPGSGGREYYLRVALNWTAAFTIASFAYMVLANSLACQPVSRNWNLDPKKICIASTTVAWVAWSTAAIHILSDILIYGLPFLLLPYLKLEARKKISLISIFALGGCCVAIAIARLIVFHEVSFVPLLGLMNHCETTIAIIVACCPPLKWLIKSLKFHKASDEPDILENTRMGKQEWGTYYRPSGNHSQGVQTSRIIGDEEVNVGPPNVAGMSNFANATETRTWLSGVDPKEKAAQDGELRNVPSFAGSADADPHTGELEKRINSNTAAEQTTKKEG